MTIDPSMALNGIGPTQPGSEWSIGSIDGSPGVGGSESTSGGSSFASALGDQLNALQKTQSAAAEAGRSLADGTATDPTAAIVAVERAQLSMQLASQLRTKGVEAVQSLLHTQV